MATFNDSGLKSFQATAAALLRGQRVSINSSGLMLASGADNLAVGVLLESVAASGVGTVKLFTSPGTFFMSAAGPITAGATLFAIAGGLVDDAGSVTIPFIACEAAAAVGNLIECAAKA